MTMELTPATVTIGLINYRKPPGVRANVAGVRALQGGAISGEDIALSGAGLNAQGSAAFRPRRRARAPGLSRRAGGARERFRPHMTETPAQGLKVKVTGRSADGTGLGRTDLTNNKASDAKKKSTNEPFLIEANLDRLVLREHVTWRLRVIDQRARVSSRTRWRCRARLSKTARLSGDLVVNKGERTIRLKTNNAGLLLRGLFGFTSMRGGSSISTRRFRRNRPRRRSRTSARPITAAS